MTAPPNVPPAAVPPPPAAPAQAEAEARAAAPAVAAPAIVPPAPPPAADAELRRRAAAEERLRMAQQAGGVGSFEWFPDSGKLLVSATYRRLWGLADEQEVTAELLLGLVDERDRGQVGQYKLERVDNPLEYAEYRVRRADDGALRWLARQGEVLPGATPGSRRYVGVCFDVTERKQMEQALRASEDRLAAIFGQAAVGMAELDLDGNYRRVNEALCRMLGRGAEQLLALNMDDLIHPDERAGNRVLLARLVERGEPFTLEKRYRRPDQSWVWISSSISRLDDEQGRPLALIAVKTDISERRRIEQAWRELSGTLELRVAREVAERNKAEELLRQAQKMEAVGQLTGGVAHDFNNVLQIIYGNLQLLQQDGADPRSAQRLETAIGAVERGAKLSSQLLAFARRQPLRPQVVDLGRLAVDMEGLLRRALGEAVALEWRLAPGLWNTLVDPGQMESVILNLAINARDAMGGSGRLRVRLANVELDASFVGQLPELPPGQYVRLTVSDTGCGMSAEVMRRAFEPFFTTKPLGEGSGLGLSMAYGFVKQSHGHIKLDSRPGRGSRVRIYLPRSEQAAPRLAAAAAEPVAGGSETVLVVEDDAALRATVVDMLVALGYRVLQAGSGDQAWLLLQAGARVELLFTDVVMPGALRSPELARLARSVLPDIAVLFTSGYPQGGIVHGGRLDAGLELLSKPYRREATWRARWGRCWPAGAPSWPCAPARWPPRRCCRPGRRSSPSRPGGQSRLSRPNRPSRVGRPGRPRRPTPPPRA
ncbi:PAS domain-containing sensor histidine kinase [Rugamonas sp. DEMB1]|uniref:hybrid sensor histidine kinase/response regulator n=1 Tax=Rugamonas sp. DEMB1 TaxID=3039386 RepID=UPI00244A6A0C|nr:PAS domain S-box protein [Rugamonas sp. DEMB1]WGG51853.1 PAS domain S-box protein [Rugamonas sp. DEMB1]